jgi:predicted phosphodiesterase
MSLLPSRADEIGSPSAIGFSRRRRLLIWSLIFSVLPLTATTCPIPRGFLVEPYLQAVGAEGATILWETREPGDSRVEWGASADMDQFLELSCQRTLHEVRLEGLAPDSAVYYRVRSRTEFGEVTSPVYHFRTAPPSADAVARPFSFALVGDTQDQPEVWRRVARRIFAERPAFVVHAGDIVGHGPSKDEWTDEFFEPSGGIFSFVPFFSVIGNHELDAGWFYRYLDHPAPEYRYTFLWGGVQFFMLDSNRSLKPGSSQFRWLAAELASSTARWKIAVHHHPVWTSDADDYGDTRERPVAPGDSDVRALIPLYERYDVDLVCYGHVHYYERSRPLRGNRVDAKRGITYLQVGGGGGHLDEIAANRNWYAAKLRRDHHFVMIDVNDEHLEIRAHDIEGMLFDQLRIEKPKRVPSTPEDSEPRTAQLR